MLKVDSSLSKKVRMELNMEDSAFLAAEEWLEIIEYSMGRLVPIGN